MIRCVNEACIADAKSEKEGDSLWPGFRDSESELPPTGRVKGSPNGFDSGVGVGRATFP